jgi:ribosomal protein S13
MLVPKEMKVEHSSGVKDLTDEQLDAMIEYLKASLEAQAQSAKVIEGKLESSRACRRLQGPRSSAARPACRGHRWPA